MVCYRDDENNTIMEERWQVVGEQLQLISALPNMGHAEDDHVEAVDTWVL